MRKFFLLFFIIMLSFSTSSAEPLSQPSSMFVVSTGNVRVPDNNWANARKKAIFVAMRNAVVTQVARIIREGGGKFADYVKNLEPILQDSGSYVQSYQILEEVIAEDENLLTIRINAGLFNVELTRAIREMGVSRKKGDFQFRTLILVGEKNLMEDGRLLPFDEFEPISEPLITEIFQENQIQVLDRYKVFETVDEEMLEKALKGDIKAGINIGLQCGVEAVIMGSSFSRELPPSPKNPDQIATQVNISLRLVRVDKGLVVGVSSEFARGYGATQEESELDAMKKASTKVCSTFVRQIKGFRNSE